MTRQTIKPALGKTVPNPRTGKPLKESGESEKLTAYWLRRIAEGSVTTVPGGTVDRTNIERAEVE